jgi:Flp pilus assembly protein protease CpaA
LFEVLRLFVVVVFYGYAAISDYKHMTVKNWVFATPLVVGVILALFEGWNYPIIEVVLQCVCFYVVWRIGVWGGGDAKALMSLAILTPLGFTNNIIFFPLIVLWIACLVATGKLVQVMLKKQSVKTLQVPLLTYLFAGIVVAQLTGQQLITLIWR